MSVRAFLLAVFLLLGCTSAYSVNPEERLPDPVLETRARDITSGLRCLQCQNQSVDDSNSSFARDIRIMVRQRLVAGESDEAIIDDVVERYGSFVLLKPPVILRNMALWFGPLAVALLGALCLWRWQRRTETASAEAALTRQEQTAIGKLSGDITRD